MGEKLSAKSTAGWHISHSMDKGKEKEEAKPKNFHRVNTYRHKKISISHRRNGIVILLLC